MDTQQYLDVFIDESQENLQAINDHLLELEKDPHNLEHVEVIFRAAHTLKGMSATMGYSDLADLTHQLENVLDSVRNGTLNVEANLLDVLLDAVEKLEEMVADISNGGDGKAVVRETIEQLKLVESGDVPNSSSPSSATSSQSIALDTFEETVIEQAQADGLNAYHLKITIREDCLLKAARVYMVFEVLEDIGEVIKSNPPVEALEEEQFDLEFEVVVIASILSDDLKRKILNVSEIDAVDVVTIDAVQPSDAREEAGDEVKAMEKSQSNDVKPASVKKTAGQKTIRVNIERLDILMNLFEELVIDRGRLEQISSELNHRDLSHTVERMSRISGELQNIILTMRMVPIDQVFNRFPRMVRQLARDLGKDINFVIEGAETELDRTVIDEIGDPLVHLIRNALDHGIEMPDERRKHGKPEQGTILLKAYHSGNHVFVEITDDGNGINREKVLQKALANGVLAQAEAEQLTDRQVNELILASGFSTADNVSDLSGRGVGLDVVKNTIESFGGSINIDSELNKGSTFTIELPLTLSIISAMLCHVGDETYAIPLSSIIETAMVRQSEITSVQQQQMMNFRGSVIPLVYLKDTLDVPVKDDRQVDESVIVIRKGDKMAGVVVDQLIGQQEVVLKNLGNYLDSVFAISGATILGDGEVALILDVNELIK